MNLQYLMMQWCLIFYALQESNRPTIEQLAAHPLLTPERSSGGSDDSRRSSLSRREALLEEKEKWLKEKEELLNKKEKELDKRSSDLNSKLSGFNTCTIFILIEAQYLIVMHVLPATNIAHQLLQIPNAWWNNRSSKKKKKKKKL